MALENAEAPCSEHGASMESGSLSKPYDNNVNGMVPGVKASGATPLSALSDVPTADQATDAPAPAKPCIKLVDGMLPEVVDESEALLMRPDLAPEFRVYQRSGQLVRIVTLPAATNTEGVTRHAGSVLIRPVDQVYLRDILGRLARFERFDRRMDAFKAVDVPKPVAETLLGRQGTWTLPVLRGVITCPTLRADGSLLAEMGYDADSGYYLASALKVTVPEHPMREDAQDALNILKRLLREFPFVSLIDLAVALAFLLTCIVRSALDNVPLFGSSAPVRGSGKSTLAELGAIFATGRMAAVVAATSDPDELRKRLESSLLAGDTLVSLDNLNGVLHSDLLCQATTQAAVRVRPLGVSMQIEVPNTALFCVNGNNLSISGDLARRTLMCRLDPRCERPEEREFTANPISDALANRAVYVSAALTVLRAYILAAPRLGLSRFGSFERWSDLVRSALVWAGEADPCESRMVIMAEDPELAALAAMLTAWFGKFGIRAVTVQQVLAEAAHEGDSDLAASVEAVATVRGRIDAQRFGLWCRRNMGRIAGGYKLERANLPGASAHWRVVSDAAGVAPAAGAATPDF